MCRCLSDSKCLLRVQYFDGRKPTCSLLSPAVETIKTKHSRGDTESWKAGKMETFSLNLLGHPSMTAQADPDR